jgi:hypothetical protein
VAVNESEWLEVLANLPLETQFTLNRSRLAMRGASRKQLMQLVMQYMVQSYALQDLNTRLLDALREAQNEPSD